MRQLPGCLSGLALLFAVALQGCSSELVVVAEREAGASGGSAGGGAGSSVGGTGQTGGSASGGNAGNDGFGGSNGGFGGSNGGSGGSSGFGGSNGGFGGSSAASGSSFGAAGSGGAGAGGGAFCTPSAGCGGAQYCELDGCASLTGRCADLPFECDDVAVPSCGCSGVTYYNACVRAWAGEPELHLGECQETALPCGGAEQAECGAGYAVCMVSDSGGCALEQQGTCWVLPCPFTAAGSPNLTSCDGSFTCADACTAQQYPGRVYRDLPCPNG